MAVLNSFGIIDPCRRCQRLERRKYSDLEGTSTVGNLLIVAFMEEVHNVVFAEIDFE